jgi:hypothetical protein
MGMLFHSLLLHARRGGRGRLAPCIEPWFWQMAKNGKKAIAKG